MFTKMAHEAFMKPKQVRRRSWGGATIYIYILRLSLTVIRCLYGQSLVCTQLTVLPPADHELAMGFVGGGMQGLTQSGNYHYIV